MFALGCEPVPAALSPSVVSGELGGAHRDGDPRFLATGGGTVAGDTGCADESPSGRVF